MLDRLLKKVERPGRYIGGEFGCVQKKWDQVNTHFCFAFPDLYEIGMSFLGLQILYKCVNEEEDLVMERVFAPASDMEQLLRSENAPLFSLESKRPLGDFDALGFTLQYEMSFTNILNMLDLAGIPLTRKERQKAREEGKRFPLILAGGPCSYNPEPLADFVDAFLIGDGEELLPAFLHLIGEEKNKSKIGNDNGFLTNQTVDSLLKQACQLQGVYVPAFYKPVYGEDYTLTDMVPTYEGAPLQVRKAFIADLNKAKFPTDPLVPLIEITQDRSVCELFRGCTRGCRFCQAGMIYRPVRERSKEEILRIAKELAANTGQDEMTLLSLSTSDYSAFHEMAMAMVELCQSQNVGLSLPSLRLDTFSFDVLQEIQKYRKTGLTFAPEAGTQRLRDIINKNITEENIYGAVRQAIALGWKHIKLYFMMGLPGESMEDLDGIAKIARGVMNINRELNVPASRRFTVTVSVSNFVPKAHTPLQWVSQDEDFTDKHNYLFEKMKIKGVTFNYHDSPVSRLEAVFARGDRRTGDFLRMAFQKGCTFDSWSEKFNLEGWQEAAAEFEEKYGFSTDWYRTRQRSYDERLPWDHIDCGVAKDFLMKEMEKAKAAMTTDDCRKGCNGCGFTPSKDCKVCGIWQGKEEGYCV